MHAEEFETYPAINPYDDFPFMFQDIPCRSLAALCLALTSPFLELQKAIAAMDQANLKDHFSNIDLNDQHDLYWQGKTFRKSGHDLDSLMESIFYALGENEDFKEYLFQSGSACIIHTYDTQDPLQHVLDADIFAHHLMMVRYHFGFDR